MHYSLFTDFVRTDASPRTLEESEYQYIDRLATPGAERMRNRINQRFSEFPKGKPKKEMRRTLRAPADRQFSEKLFELDTHHFLRSTGAEILAVEHSLPNGTQVDFVAKLNGQQFYVEAVTKHDISLQHAEMERLERALEPLRNHSVSAGVRVHREGGAELDLKKVFEGVEHSIFAHAGVESWCIALTQADWVLQLYLVRRKEIPRSFITVQCSAAREVLYAKKILAKLVEKADKYGDLQHPLIIVCAVQGPAFSPLEHAISAVFGGDEYRDINLARLPPAFLREFSIQGHGVFQTAERSKNLYSVVAFDYREGIVEVPSRIHLLNPRYQGPAIALEAGQPVIRANGASLVGAQGLPLLEGPWVSKFFNKE